MAEIDKEREVEVYLASVENMRAKGQIGDDDYRKCLVQLAWDFLNAGGQGERRAWSLINRCGGKYFEPEGVCVHQGRVDEAFGVLTIKLAYKLLQYGLVGGDENIYGSTQPPAEA